MQVSPEIAAAIRDVPHYRDGHYRDLDVSATLDYHRRRFVDHCPVKKPNIAVADIGAGYGWLAMAFAAFSDARPIAVEPDAPRLEAGQRIAELLGLKDKIDWRIGNIMNLPISRREATVTYCIEVLEHVYRDAKAFSELDRVTAEYLVLTTPNGAFPIVQHDTFLPFCHWLPMRLRNVYARIAGRSSMQHGNRFWNPLDLAIHLKNFERVSGFFHFKSAQDYFDLYPYYLPYGRGEWRRRPSWQSELFFRTAGLFGRHSHLLLHNLAGTLKRVR